MKEWYLLNNNTKPNSIGGFENEAFNDYKNDAFSEALSTDIATDVIVYDSYLSKSRHTRCIIQGNTADTYLNSVMRTALFSVGTVKGGMYVYFEDGYWLITGYPGNNGVYEKATLSLCQTKIKWQNDEGRIIERWVNIASASKYNVGVTSNETITLTSNDFTILVSEDDDSASLDGKRVFIDRDTKNPRKVFHVTRSDDALYLYGVHGGMLSFLADKDEINLDVDRPDLGICDYISYPKHKRFKPYEVDAIEGNTEDNIQDEEADTDTTVTEDENNEIIESESEMESELESDIPKIIAKIKGNNNLKVEFPRKYSVVFYDFDKKDITDTVESFEWNIKILKSRQGEKNNRDVLEESDIIQSSGDNNSIILQVDNRHLIGCSFLLQVVIDGYVFGQKEIIIVSPYETFDKYDGQNEITSDRIALKNLNRGDKSWHI